VDLPTYTNIWRIEKRLYKLYDFRLPAPLPITWIAVFSGITFPYVVFLFAIGVPFNHDLVWLYVLPPGVLTWLITRPVIESKRLPELIGSQLRYLAEPHTWTRMAPATEKEEIVVLVKIWRRIPPKPRLKARKTRPGKVRPPAHTKPLPHSHVVLGSAESVDRFQPVDQFAPRAELEPATQFGPQAEFESATQFGPQAELEPATQFEPQDQSGPQGQFEPQDQFEPVQERATARPAPPQRTSAQPVSEPPPVSFMQSLVSTGWEPRPAPLIGQPTRPGPLPELTPLPALAPEPAAPEPAALEPAEPEPADMASEPQEPEPAAPGAVAGQTASEDNTERAQAEDEAKALELSHDAEPVAWLSPPADLPAWSGPPQPSPASRPVAHRTRPHVPHPQPTATASVVDLDNEHPVPSVERALSAPGGRRDLSWRRRVKVVAGGQGPGKRDQEEVDRARAQQALAGPRWIVVLGCHSAAGQTLTTLMTGRLLVSLRHHPVAALTGDIPTPVKAAALLAGHGGPAGFPRAKGLDIIAEDSVDYQRLRGLLANRYPLTIVDPAPAGLTRVLSLADQLIIVAPATDQAASNLASTQQWLDAHGYGDLAARAVTVINGVHKEQMPDVLRAESVARGRCRAIVRVPYDVQLTARHIRPIQALPVQTRLAYTALAGVVVAGLASPAAQPTPKESR
jgi:hypothetical protein